MEGLSAVCPGLPHALEGPWLSPCPPHAHFNVLPSYFIAARQQGCSLLFHLLSLPTSLLRREAQPGTLFPAISYIYRCAFSSLACVYHSPPQQCVTVTSEGLHLQELLGSRFWMQWDAEGLCSSPSLCRGTLLGRTVLPKEHECFSNK